MLLVGSISHDRHYHIIQSRDEGGVAALCVFICKQRRTAAPSSIPFLLFFLLLFLCDVNNPDAISCNCVGVEGDGVGMKKGEYILYTMQQVLISLNANTAARKSDMEANVRHARPQHAAVCIRSVYMLALYIELARM